MIVKTLCPVCGLEVEIVEPHPMIRPRPDDRLDTHGESRRVGCDDGKMRDVFIRCAASGAEVT